MTRVVVLIKDFDSAKQRLSPALDPRRRRLLAVSMAVKALAAAGPAAIVVAGSPEAATLAADRVKEVISKLSLLVHAFGAPLRLYHWLM